MSWNVLKRHKHCLENNVLKTLDLSWNVLKNVLKKNVFQNVLNCLGEYISYYIKIKESLKKTNPYYVTYIGMHLHG